MDATQMQKRCPNTTLIGATALHGYRLAFTIYAPHRNGGAADIVPDPRGVVYGLLYEISGEDLARLDCYEGVPTHYRRIEVSIDHHRVYTYEVVTKQDGLSPSREYLSLIQNAATTHSFPPEYQAMLNGILTT